MLRFNNVLVSTSRFLISNGMKKGMESLSLFLSRETKECLLIRKAELSKKMMTTYLRLRLRLCKNRRCKTGNQSLSKFKFKRHFLTLIQCLVPDQQLVRSLHNSNPR